MRHLLLILVFTASTVALAGKYEAIYTGEVTYEAHVSVDAIEKAIKKALIGRSWKVREATPGQVVGRLNLRGHQADIEINYADGKIVLNYVSSQNLGHRTKKGVEQIHRNYNRWITYLERDINVFLEDT